MLDERSKLRVDLVDADHVSAFHKLEINDLFYFLDKKVVLKTIKDHEGKEITVLCTE